ncbi:sugar ABC transporter permease [Spirochaeta dissipatitropha]
MNILHNAVRRSQWNGYLYILPWIIGFMLFQMFPMAHSLYISMTEWDILGDPVFVGLSNYRSLLFDDPVFIRALLNTLLFMFVGNGVGIVLAVFIAALLNEKVPGRGVIRTLFFLPNLVIPVAIGLMLSPIFGSERFGLINLFLGLFGIDPVYWLEDPVVTPWVVVITNFWFIGAAMIIFLAGISGQPKSYHEAAEIDGAGWWYRLFHITLPLLMPVIFFQLVMGTIYGLQIFDVPAALARMGGSAGALNMGRRNSLATLVYYLYTRGFRYWEMGAAAAIGWFLFLIGLVLTFIIILIMKRNQLKSV